MNLEDIAIIGTERQMQYEFIFMRSLKQWSHRGIELWKAGVGNNLDNFESHHMAKWLQ